MIRSFQWDLARQVERLDWLLKQLPKYADWGYNEVHLHLEDAVEYPSLPAVARRDAYTTKQFAKLVETASRVGIKVVPIVNLLGHTQYLIKTAALRDLNELRSPDGAPLGQGQICPLHPRTMDVAEKLLRDMKPFCTAGKVHVGLDESFHLGKCPRCRAEIEAEGRGSHFARYVGRLNALAGGLGLQIGMWADMFYFIPEAIPLLPSGITAYEWYYHAFKRHPRVELFNFAEVDITTALRKQAVGVYGCPMNGAFRYEPLPHFGDRLNNIIAWWRHHQRIGAEGFLVSSWEPYRLAVELTTAVDAAAASLWLEPEITEPAKMLERGFQRLFGKKGKPAAKLALQCDRFPFGGYPRWEINERWDTLSSRESLRTYRREESFFRKLSAKTAAVKTPIALRSSIEFRHYLAERDLFVRQLRRGVKSDIDFAQALRRGRRSARTMWNQTRDKHVISPNERIVDSDSKRFGAYLRHKHTELGWQLCYRVWNFAPSAQLVGVEQQEADGSWKTIQSCHTIEFQTRAATPRSDIVREHAAPVTWDGDRLNPPRLRLFCRGMGAVKIGAIELVSLKTCYVPRGPRSGWRTLGRKAPKRGWPDFDGAANTGEIELAFGSSSAAKVQ
jgi:hypothetical protein